MEIAIYMLIILGLRVLLGVVAGVIADVKGYKDNWYLKGFLSGTKAVIKIIRLPKIEVQQYESVEKAEYKDTIGYLHGKGTAERRAKQGIWTCVKCNATNPAYTGTCSCGQTKEENELEISRREQEKLEAERQKNKDDEVTINLNENEYNSIEKMIISILMKNHEGMSAMDISRYIPKNVNPKDVSEAFSHLKSMEVIQNNDMGLYILKNNK